MADKIVTTLEGYIVGGSGSFRIADTVPRTNVKVLSIWAEQATTLTTLTHVDPAGVETNAIATRGLSAMAATGLYTAGVNSYFKNITLATGSISCNPL